MPVQSRQIFTHGPYGMRQLKETLRDLMVGLIIRPDDMWLVSPWISDFDLLDNRCGNWNTVDPSWGPRIVRFSELLVSAMDAGCRMTYVTNSHEMNRRFYEQLVSKMRTAERPTSVVKDSLHTKGLLTSSFFLAGSMNFTYSGTHSNDERVQLTIDQNAITEARIEFESRYSV